MMSTDHDVGHLDVLIVGAGLSGIGAALYLQNEGPWASFALFEARESIGGTWDLFRYPGIRSDSDMYTLGYSFRPWKDAKSIADGPSILSYVRETAVENGVEELVRFHHRALRAEFDSARGCWTVHARREDTGEEVRIRAGFVMMCSGYYRYDEGYSPRFAGSQRFAGPIVHPQKWTEGIDYADKRVVVIGSGPTAVTLVPAMAKTAAHVTLLQRTPSYVLPVPSRDKLNARLTRLLGEERAFAVTRRLNIARQVGIWRFCQKYPKTARRLIRKLTTKMLPEGYPVDEHLNPPYNPWDQRMFIVPDGDLFRAIAGGKASLVTGHIETFTENGVLLK